MDLQRFYAGACFDAYRYLGGHMEAEGGVFRTFAPSAAGVSLLAEWEDWQERPMERVLDGNFWEARSPGAVPGQRYKYRIWKRDGSFLDHCDPYGFWMEKRPHTASVLCGPEQDYIFSDQAWMAARTTCQDRPLHIYEVHAGSWKKPGPGPEDWYDWDQLGELLLPYVQELGCNYIEFLPLSEHPSDASWGYQNTGFFSPTSRYGSPRQLKAFVDRCHQEGVGVLLDFVPVHFAVDDYALWQYDGTALYEYPHSDVGVSEWGSCNFMHSRGEVRSFLQSAAQYWLEEFHFDGLRMDAVSRLIYWQGDPARGENQNGLAFLRGMNLGLKALHPTAILAAEDSTAWPGVTAPAQEGGLGFDYKWDIGWMHDTLTYFQIQVEAGLTKPMQISTQRMMVFDHLFSQEQRISLPFHKIVIDRKMQDVSLLIMIPVLRTVCGEQGMLTVEDKLPTRSEHAENGAKQRLQILHIMKCQGADHHIEAFRRKAYILHGCPHIGDARIIAQLFRLLQHPFGDVDADRPDRQHNGSASHNRSPDRECGSLADPAASP